MYVLLCWSEIRTQIVWMSIAFKQWFLEECYPCQTQQPCIRSGTSWASLPSEDATSSWGNLLQAPSLIISELLHSDSLASFLSLPLHVCVRWSNQAAKQPSVNTFPKWSIPPNHISSQCLWHNESPHCVLINIHVFPSCNLFFCC